LKEFIQVKYNFLPFVEDTYNIVKNNLKFFSYENHKQSQFQGENKVRWPGLRTDELSENNPFLYLLIIGEAKKNLNFNIRDYEKIDIFIHLRLKEDNSKDFIHQDSTDTLLIYLSPTNLKSGTNFYNLNHQKIAEVSFLQNTAVFFDGEINHCSFKNYGDSIENGRMTINMFCHKK